MNKDATAMELDNEAVTTYHRLMRLNLPTCPDDISTYCTAIQHSM